MITFKTYIENNHEFNYSNLAKEMWREKLKTAKDTFKISFDTENDDRKTSKDIIIPQNEWKFTKCKFKCQSCVAGGDWEDPIIYFNCQLVSGYAKNLHKNDCFCIIPDIKNGNPHLVKVKNGWSAPHHDDNKNNLKYEEKKAWDYLENYLTELVKDEIKKVRANRN